jgi:hypothetical protein
MWTVREAIGAASVLAGVVVLAGISHQPTKHGRRLERERIAVQTAADHLTRDQIAGAWMQARLGATAALAGITEAVGVRYLAAHHENDAIIVTFAGRAGRCLDLVSRPEGNTVERRAC